MAMSREEQDAFDRRMAGIMDPRDPMADTQRGMAGGPIASYGMSDLRRLLGLGAPGSPAPSVDAAEMYQQLTPRAPIPVPPGGYDAPSPSIPYMPSTDPRGAAAPIPAPPLPVSPRGGMPARPAAPIPAPPPPPAPRAAAPARPAAALPVMRGLPPNEADFTPPRPDTFGGVSPADMDAGQSVMNRSLEDRRRFPMNDTTYFLRDPSRVYTYDELEEARRGGGTGSQRLNREQLVRALNTYGYNQLNPVQPFRRTGLFRPQQ